jgi:16S rRNA (guanine966-N2)-methyltransferase
VVTCVEHGRRTTGLIRDNLRSLGLGGVEVVAAPVGRALAHPPRAPYDIAFLDPPYALPVADVEADLSALRDNDWLVDGAVVVVESSSRGPGLTWPDGLTGERTRTYGETMLWYGHAAALRP